MEIRYGRKRKGIKKQIQDKIEEWLQSINSAGYSINQPLGIFPNLPMAASTIAPRWGAAK